MPGWHCCSASFRSVTIPCGAPLQDKQKWNANRKSGFQFPLKSCEWCRNAAGWVFPHHIYSIQTDSFLLQGLNIMFSLNVTLFTVSQALGLLRMLIFFFFILIRFEALGLRHIFVYNSEFIVWLMVAYTLCCKAQWVDWFRDFYPKRTWSRMQRCLSHETASTLVLFQ